MAYITLQGSHIRIQAGRLIVESKDNIKVLDAPTGHVARIVCFGSMGVSAGARTWALSEDVELVFISRRGGYLGQMMPACSPRRAGRLRAQLRAAADLDLAVGFGRAVVEAKVRKQMVLLQRLGRRDTSEVVAASVHQMRQSLLHLPHCSNTAEVMGIEGASAKVYFSGLGAIVPHEVAIVGRSRPPPQDINAALSYGYAILLSECVSALAAAGLDPAIGLLHAISDTRPSLALDLMEEFRPLVVDQVVIAAARKCELRAEHARREDGRAGVLLTKAGRELVIDRYERRMLQTTRGALPDFGGSLRRHVYRQAQRVARLVSDPSARWTGLSWR